MARNGQKIFDTDTHVGPVMEVLERYLTDAERSKLLALEEFKFKDTRDNHKDAGSTTYTRGLRTFRRRLGEAAGEERKPSTYNAFTGPKVQRVATPVLQLDSDPALRIRDMDVEGVDVNLLLPSGWFGTWTTTDDLSLEMGMYRAYHRWMNDYCGAHPDRLGGVLLVSARDVAGSLQEIHRWAKARWPWGIFPLVPTDMPLDHPDLEPIWAAAQEHDFVITLHTFTNMPPYAPGAQDNWDNMFLTRSASHPWCGMRNMAALIGSGVMDRYPRLRIGTLEAGHGWLPFWLSRIDEHAETCSRAIQELKFKPSEYAMSGRYFQSIEIHEGADMTNSVAERIGDDVLMYASDYPHVESRFPESVNIVMSWEMPESRKRKLFWENPVKFYTRSGLSLKN